jgi:hypothetical protein
MLELRFEAPWDSGASRRWIHLYFSVNLVLCWAISTSIQIDHPLSQTERYEFLPKLPSFLAHTSVYFVCASSQNPTVPRLAATRVTYDMKSKYYCINRQFLGSCSISCSLMNILLPMVLLRSISQGMCNLHRLRGYFATVLTSKSAHC